MDQINTQPNQNNPIDHESFSLLNQPKKSSWKTPLIIIGIVLIVALFFVGGMFLRSYFSPKPAQAPITQIPAGFTFPTTNPPAAATTTVADSIDLIEKDLNTIDLKTFETDINNDLGNISKSL
ncbi:MAG: hypothetical protein NUV83_03290 [Candidatus Wolfebacteria bacterium]|nr:hypothetical protein [Candidatus Wolfebacteria bacterium]